MRLSKEDFFELTPRLFQVLREAWIQQQRRWQTLVALLRLDVINYSICRPERRILLEDLVPNLPSAVSASTPRRMTAQRRQDVAAKMRLFFEVKQAD